MPVNEFRPYAEKETRLPLLSLFSGAGGLDLGFKQADFETRLAIDNSVAAIGSYQRNHPNVKVERIDISQLTGIELIGLWNQSSSEPPIGVIGGPPCQAFSLGNSQPKSDDPRRELSFKYARLLQELNGAFGLSFFLFENVKGLLSARNAGDFSRLKTVFEDAGFELFISLLDASQFGVAQRRRRLFIIGINRSLTNGKRFDFPEPAEAGPSETVAFRISDLPEPMYFNRSIKPCDIPFHENHWTMVPRSEKFSTDNPSTPKCRGRSFRVLDWNAPSLTVAYGNREVHVHPNGHRRLSVYEAMLLQGFPHGFVLLGNLTEQFRQISDAVPPPVAAALGRAVLRYLRSKNRDERVG